MIYPGRFLALVLLASVTSLGLIYHYFGFSSAPPVLVPGLEQEVDVRLKPVVPFDDEPTILKPTENAVFETLSSDGMRQQPSDDAYPDIGDGAEEPPLTVIPLDSSNSGSTTESADLRSAPFEFPE